MKARKIKDLRKKGNRQPKTEAQLEASRIRGVKVMLTNNPMKNPESKKRMVETKRKKYRKYPGGESGKPGKPENITYGFKGKKHTEKSKAILSMKKIGFPAHPNQIKSARKLFTENNPMKNPEIVKKHPTLFTTENNPVRNPKSLEKIKIGNIKNYLTNKNHPFKRPEVIEKRIQRFKENNPMKNPEIVKKHPTLFTTENNPMKDPLVRKKLSDRIKELHRQGHYKKVALPIAVVCIIILFSTITIAVEGLEIRIINGTIEIQGYIITELAGKISAGFIEHVNGTLGDNLIICSEIVNITQGNETISVGANCTLNIDYYKDLPFSFNTTGQLILNNPELQLKYENCLVDKSAFEAGLNVCVSVKNEQGDFKDNYTLCSSTLLVCESERSSAQSEKNKIEKESEEKKNRQWVWGIVGLILGALVTLYYKGHIGGPRSRKPEDSYNPRQAA